MDPSTASPQNLFKQWRNGDGAAGQAMAQRFSDWYYAITACRLGDEHGRGPLQRACVRFQQGILSVTNPQDLVDWAHGILAEEVGMAGGRIAGGDFPSALTRQTSPTTLLQGIVRHLAPTDVSILAHAYDSDVALDQVTREAEALGGYPLAVLKARLALKRALKDHAGVAFTEVPDLPNLDLGPLPLYEAGRMVSTAEESGFEKWMLTDMRLCKDIAEFGVFAQSLRAGALRGKVQATSAPSATAPSALRQSVLDDPPPGGGGGSVVPIAVVGLLLVGGILLVIAAGALYFWRW